MNLRDFLAQLKQRHIYRVAVIYAAAAWLSLQVADIVLESFDGPPWVMQWLIVLVTLGFPVTLFISWMVDSPTVDDSPHAAVAEAPVQSSGPVKLSDRPSLVVLPFDCYSFQPSDVWYTDALTEDLTTLISRLPGFFVVARNTAATYRERSVDARKIGEELAVRYLLEGSVRRAADHLRVNVQLIETESGTHLWADKYDRPVTEFEQLHDELCRAIVFKLGAELTRSEINLSRRKPPAEWGVWDLYQQAKGVLQFSGWSGETFAETARLLRQAIAIDPDYAPARAYLSLVLALGHWARMYPDRESAYAAAIEEGERAMALAPDSSEVLGYVGCALSDLGHPERGIPIIDRAIELNPSNSQAFAALGAAKVVSGRVEEGIGDLTHAMQLSPADPGIAPWSMLLSFARAMCGNTREALSWAEKASSADPRFYGGYLALAVARFLLGQRDEAQRALDEAKHLNPDLCDEAVAAMIGPSRWDALAEAGLAIPAGPGA